MTKKQKIELANILLDIAYEQASRERSSSMWFQDINKRITKLFTFPAPKAEE